jgi:tRNA dimethylallyltransferase
MEKLLVVCGPTATGKTALALFLAKRLDGELVSADSKQVYKGLDIGTGKDVPAGARKDGYYEYEGVKIWGYDLVSARGGYSVSKYVAFARGKIGKIQKEGKLPILVGGTGLYIKAIVDGIATVKIPRNDALRKNLVEKGVEDLFNILAQLDPIKAGSLNTSDRKNPRRLIRAIEIATVKLESRGKKFEERTKGYDSVLFIGLSAPKEIIFQKIDARVVARLEAGLEDEIKRLLDSGVNWEDQSMSSLGYRQWRGYFEGKMTREEAIEQWIQEEKKYAKRQTTWFKKDARINWHDTTKRDWQKKVERLVNKWYSS